MSKPEELRDQSDEQLELLLKETQQALFRLRLQSETERLEAPSEIIKAKREIARIKTILRLREIEREKAATPVAALGFDGIEPSRVESSRIEVSGNERLTTRERDEPTVLQPRFLHRPGPQPSQDGDRVRDVRQDEQDPAGRGRDALPAPEVRQDAPPPHRLPRARRDQRVAPGRHRRDHGDPAAVEAQAVADRPDHPPGGPARPGRRGRGGEGLSRANAITI